MKNVDAPPAPTPNDDYVISYKSLLKSIGVLGMSLPFVLVIGDYFFTKDWAIRDSISHYYYSKMSVWFTGTLCGLALFMYAYRRPDIRDRIAAAVACISVLGVAFFPTAESDNALVIDQNFENAHFIFAAVFFSSLVYFALCLFRRTSPLVVLTPQKITRNNIYTVCGYLMLGCMLGILVYTQWLEKNYPLLDNLRLIFWLETIALVAFGFAWLVKGEFILKDKYMVPELVEGQQKN